MTDEQIEKLIHMNKEEFRKLYPDVDDNEVTLEEFHKDILIPQNAFDLIIGKKDK